MSNTLYIHIGYWIVILLILFVGYLIYPKKQKKSNKRVGKNFCIEQSYTVHCDITLPQL